MDKEEKREREVGGGAVETVVGVKKKEKKEREPHTRTRHCDQRSSEHGVPVLRPMLGPDLAGLREENPRCADDELRGGRGPRINHRLKA